MGILARIASALRRLFGTSPPAGSPDATNVISLAASRKNRSKAIEKERRAQAEQERHKRWTTPTKRK